MVSNWLCTTATRTKGGYLLWFWLYHRIKFLRIESTCFAGAPDARLTWLSTTDTSVTLFCLVPPGLGVCEDYPVELPDQLKRDRVLDPDVSNSLRDPERLGDLLFGLRRPLPVLEYLTYLLIRDSGPLDHVGIVGELFGEVLPVFLTQVDKLAITTRLPGLRRLPNLRREVHIPLSVS
jgi:hypothetical protein